MPAGAFGIGAFPRRFSPCNSPGMNIEAEIAAYQVERCRDAY
jgi:hypothetical protein